MSFWVLGFRLWLFCVLLSCFLCLLVTPRYLSHLYSHTWEWPIKTKGLMTVRASSVHGTGGKKRAVMTPLETIESLDSETQLLARNKLVISFRLCRTAKLDLASAWKAHRSVSHSTTAPMSSTSCVSARRRSQKTGRKPPRVGFSWLTNLPNFQLVPLNVTNSG